MIGVDLLKILATDIKNKTNKDCWIVDIYVDSSTMGTALRHDKSCCLQNPPDLILHAILSYGKDRGLVIQSKQTYKVNRCLLPAQI